MSVEFNTYNVKFISTKKQILDVLLILTTVLFFYLAFPSGGFGNLAWFCLVPVISALRNVSGRYAFMLGLLAATLGWMAGIWWSVGGLAKVTNSHFSLMIPVVFVFCLFSALPYAISTWLYSRYKWHASFFGAIKAASIFTLLVTYIPHILPGNLAHALYLSPYQIQLAAIGGIPLLFFVVHLVNFLLAMAVINLKNNLKFSIQCIIIAFALWSGNYLFGYIGSSQLEQQLQQAKKINVAMVQPDFDISLRTREQWLQHAPVVQGLIKQASANKATDLIVLPELPVPISYSDHQVDKHIFDTVLTNKPILIATIHAPDGLSSNKQSYFNAIELIENKEFRQRYHKQKLLPMAEYLPFEKDLPILRDIFPYAPRYQPGHSSELLPIKTKHLNVNIVPLICYEAVFTNLVGEGIKLGGNLFINSVNDAWFGLTAGRDVHFALALFRSVEYRTPLVRVTNNGLSAIINAKGEIIEDSRIPALQPGYSITAVSITDIKSIYQQYPFLFMIICYLISGYAIYSGQKNYNKNISN